MALPTKKMPLLFTCAGAAFFLSCNDADFASTSAGSRKDGKAAVQDKEVTSPSTSTDTMHIEPASIDLDPKVSAPSETDATPHDGDPSAQDPQCGKGQPGLYGKVYPLVEGTKQLPDFSMMTPVGRVDTLTLDVAPRSWEVGFPSVENLQEWFAISFSGVIDVPTDGSYTFRVNSDDGSKLYINNTLVLDNDGQHSPTVKDSSNLGLKKGKYAITVDWFQGPRTHIALQLYWKTPSSGDDFAIISSDYLEHALDCTLKDLGTFP